MLSNGKAKYTNCTEVSGILSCLDTPVICKIYAYNNS